MNHMTRCIGLIAATSALLLAGCVTPGSYGTNPGGYGQPSPSYPSPSYPSAYASQMQGTVEAVDAANNRIIVVVDDLRTGRAQRLDLRYDHQTRLVYQGRESAVEGLERGDVIRFDATQTRGGLWVRMIEVVRNVRDGGYGGQYGSGYGNELRGSVALVDTRTRLIRLDGAGYGNDVQLAYDARTTVEYNGRSYRVENLQRGDVVRIQARQVGNNQWLAERIIVERSNRR